MKNKKEVNTLVEIADQRYLVAVSRRLKTNHGPSKDLMDLGDTLQSLETITYLDLKYLNIFCWIIMYWELAEPTVALADEIPTSG